MNWILELDKSFGYYRKMSRYRVITDGGLERLVTELEYFQQTM